MEDGTEVIFSPPSPKLVPPQLGGLLPAWFNLDASLTVQPIINFPAVPSIPHLMPISGDSI